MNNINTKFYILLVILLGIFTYSLNLFNKISQCSLVFVFLAVTANIISELYGRKKAWIAVTLCIIVSFCLLWDFNYYIHGRVINGIILVSFVSILLSTYCSTSVFVQLKSTCSLNTRNFAGLMMGAVVDGIVMSGFFVNIFSTSRVLSMFLKEVLFKCAYSLTVYICIFLGSFLVQKVYCNNRTTRQLKNF
ncbi:VUT family protein [Candidatus Tisiphia endosymbiont of Dascillus cervinus]|uniref:VUT family protein n=1 Tax=Candidatus Tisiphia endosymbiont of Dascillus cervinus TaxID=3066253 RepID=UPI00312C8F6C